MSDLVAIIVICMTVLSFVSALGQDSVAAAICFAALVVGLSIDRMKEKDE